MKRRNGYLQLGLAVFLSVSAILLVYDTLFGRRVLPVFGGQLIAAVQPVLIGALLAYLLAPVVTQWMLHRLGLDLYREAAKPCHLMTIGTVLGLGGR